VRAGELLTDLPTVGMQTPVVAAARLLADNDLPGLIVVDEADRPLTIMPGTQVLRMAVPAYCQDDPALARVIDESAADVFLNELAERTVADCLLARQPELSVVDVDATLLEIAALMARTRTPLVAVVDADQHLLGGITLHALLDRMLPR
jgi:predicted transcriptional regulator